MSSQLYSVVGYCADNNQPWLVHVQAKDPAHAEVEAVKTMLDLNGWEEDFAVEIQVVQVLEGKVIASSCLGTVRSGREILGTIN